MKQRSFDQHRTPRFSTCSQIVTTAWRIGEVKTEDEALALYHALMKLDDEALEKKKKETEAKLTLKERADLLARVARPLGDS